MIDTIAITIPKADYMIDSDVKLNTITRRGFTKRIYNPTKAMQRKYGYLPRVTEYDAVRKGGYTIYLRVELSLPKLMFGNNFDELEESDFGEVCWKLKDSLYHMGFKTRSVNVISQAEVSAVHYSKNIILTDYSTPSTYLKEVAKVNVTKLLDMSESTFRNEGHAVKYHSNDYEVTFYDKIKDLQQAKISEKRSVEKDNYGQLGLFDKVQVVEPFQVLRMEVRLGNKKKIKDVLKREGIKPTLTFEKLFSQATSKAVLLSTINKIEADYPAVLKLGQKAPNVTFLTELILNNPKLTYQKALAIVGLKSTLDEVGVRNFRKVTEKFKSPSWYRLNKELKSLKLGKTKDVFAVITDSINRFEKVELENYRSKM